MESKPIMNTFRILLFFHYSQHDSKVCLETHTRDESIDVWSLDDDILVRTVDGNVGCVGSLLVIKFYSKEVFASGNKNEKINLLV